ncbi:hypothetical protein [Pseudonocardia sp.]|uniref:hypothetical protein n=1 Tax=Pseudonocardia sp. TaxID=60912 RepID=UPI002630A457|nr:hypothetical protein [Pseudonocardia sp.]
MSGRWSRERAADRWRELQPFVGAPLAAGLTVVSIWPLIALAQQWSEYQRPAVAAGVYVASLALIAGLWRRGRSGISPTVALLAGVAVVVLNLTLIAEVASTSPFGEAAWMCGWGAAVPMLLAFARPVEEAVTILAALTVSSAIGLSRSGPSTLTLHATALDIALPVAAATSGLALVVALRHSAANARESRSRAEAIAERHRVLDAVEGERTVRSRDWVATIAPVLEDLAHGRRSPHDPELADTCRRLAAALRANLDDSAESILTGLLPTGSPVRITVRDQDVGHRLLETERIALVGTIRRLCEGAAGGSLQVTLLADRADAAGPQALVVLAGADIAPPCGERESGSFQTGPDGQWWYDFRLRCTAAPALLAPNLLERPPGATAAHRPPLPG